MYRLYNIFKFTTVSQKMYQGLLMSPSAKTKCLVEEFCAESDMADGTSIHGRVYLCFGHVTCVGERTIT